jgi:RepB DNA-primase from phage plasmid
MHSKYYDWPQERAAALRWLAYHDAQGHNIYVRMCLFGPGNGTTKKNALPSPWIWRDDVKDLRTGFSTLLETSPGNYQALIRLDRAATTDERERLMRAWRNAHQDSDDCSADPIHFIRVVGGHNTKKGGRWRVRFAERTTRIYPSESAARSL